MWSRHEKNIDELMARLVKKQGIVIQRECPIYNSRNKLVYVADVMTYSYKDRMKYMTMYEIKTGGKNTVSKAYEQANKTFNALRYKPNLKINFVLISDMYGVRRIKDVNF